MSEKSLTERRERQCDKHIIEVRVVFRGGTPQRQSALVANLLRTTAEFTDGWCATKDADNNKFESNGLVFHFTTDQRAKLFRDRISWYLSDTVRNQILYS